MGTCGNCGQQRGRLVDGRCNTCYRYRKRTGRDRDIERIVATNAARLEREMSNPFGLRMEYEIAHKRTAEAVRNGDHRINEWAARA